jgi:ligand-binding SRPBCC domain-containing protein
MLRFVLSTPVAKSINEVKDGFDLCIFKALKPPLISLDVERFDGCEAGGEIHLRIGLGIKFKWISKIPEHNQNSQEWYFLDIGHQLPPPLRKWRHRHRVVKREAGGSFIVDDISFSSGSLPLDYLLYFPLKFQFMLRAPIYRRVFGSPSRPAS